MMEIEKSYLVKNKNELDKILQSFDFVQKVNLTDIYYDFPDYKLLKVRKFLRIRKNKILELCSVIQEKPVRKTHEIEYHISGDIENLNQIFTEIKLDSPTKINNLESLKIELQKNELNPYLDISCIRETYKKNNIKIDVDYLKNELIVIDVEIMGTINKIWENIIQQIENNHGFDDFRGKFVECLENQNKDAWTIFQNL